MLAANSTFELMTLWASSSPSLMAFCFSHLIIAVLLLGSRGCAPGVAGSKRNCGGHDDDDRLEFTVTTIGGRGCAPEVNGRAEQSSVEAGEVDAADIRTQAGKNYGGQDDVSIAADASSEEEKCGHDDDEDELMMRAEEFIRRMNRVWRTESEHVG